jgi:hypothetical protein
MAIRLLSKQRFVMKTSDVITGLNVANRYYNKPKENLIKVSVFIYNVKLVFTRCKIYLLIQQKQAFYNSL